MAKNPFIFINKVGNKSALSSIRKDYSGISFEEIALADITSELHEEIYGKEEPTLDEVIDYGKYVWGSTPITASTRKIKTTWTSTLAEDLKGFESIDAEAELTKILSEEIKEAVAKETAKNMFEKITEDMTKNIAKDIDREIIKVLLKETWSKNLKGNE